MRYLHIAFAVVAWIFVATIVIQVFLIGLGLFDDPTFRETHRDFGYTGVGIAAIALLIVALLARPGRPLLGAVVALFVLYLVQTSLPEFRTTYPAIAAVHPVLALAIFVLALRVARLATALARAPISPAHEPPARAPDDV